MYHLDKNKQVKAKYKIEDVDIEEEKDIEVQNVDIKSSKVQDRWSRYIGAMGIDAVKKQT